MKMAKKKILLGAPATILPLVSLQAFLGAVSGYLLAKFFAGEKNGERGKIKSLSFNLGSYRVHMHHWLFGSIILAPSFYYNFLPFDRFSWGVLGG